MAIDPLATADTTPVHYVDWPAIFAGAAIATAVSLVLTTFGTAIGLSMVSPYEGEGVSKAVYLTTLGLWTIWVIVSSFMAGGYVAGRLRKRVNDATEHEVEVRDGAHGMVVWAVGIVAAAGLMAVGVTGLVGATAKAGGAAGVAVAARDGDDSTAFTIDNLLRRPAAQNVQMTDGQNASVARGRDGNATRGEVRRLLSYGMTKGDLTADSKTALARIVADQTGMSQAEAEQRVSQVTAEAKKAADTARKTGIIVGFLTAAALLIGGAAAAWAGTLGGRHRDQGTDFSKFWRWA